MTELEASVRQPLFVFRLWPFNLSVGRGGRWLWVSMIATGHARRKGWNRAVFGWGGKWRFRIESEGTYPTANEALGG